MQATLRSTACALTLALVSGSAHAGILYVDDGGGPGIDYTDIQSAIDAAGHGDKIIVHPGNYSGFILGKGVTILGFDASNTTVITSPTVISGVPGPKRAILTGMRMDILTLVSNPGHIVLDHLEIGSPSPNLTAALTLNGCMDVRMVDCDVQYFTGAAGAHGVQVSNSRFEASGSRMRGAAGYDIDCFGGTAGTGGDGLWVSDNSLISLFETDCFGGSGGHGPGFCEWSSAYGGNGGHGMYMRGASSGVIAGKVENKLKSGFGGYGSDLWSDGYAGDDMHLLGGSVVRHSGVTILDTHTGGGAMATEAIPADPFLDRLGTLQAGRLQTFWIYGTPGDAVTFYIGRSSSITIDPLQELDDLVSHERAYSLGVVPAAGRLKFEFTIPAWWPVAFDFYVQAATTNPSNERRLTNSLPIILRHLP